MSDECECKQCGEDLCPGDVRCSTCGCDCDPDETHGFKIKRRATRGDTITLEFDIVDQDGIPIDASATGFKAWFTMKPYFSLPDNRASWQGTILNGGITPVRVGTIRVVIPANATYLIADGIVKLYYDLQIKDLVGRIATIEKGLFLLSPDVTRSIDQA
jgi:hypothetical protein